MDVFFPLSGFVSVCLLALLPFFTFVFFVVLARAAACLCKARRRRTEGDEKNQERSETG
jgi:membrane protein implicated in regulation of membrane protease activity